jgi:hydrogenase maturation protease
MARPTVLIAGVGNIFLGDDGFGVAVAQRLAARSQPAGVRVVDFGIRAFDLACALTSCDAAILVDAMSRGGAPGTLYLLDPQLDEATGSVTAPAALDGHTLTPERVLRGLPRNARPHTLRLVGCEPLCCEAEFPDALPEGLAAASDELWTLSPAVHQAVEEAVQLVERLAAELLAGMEKAEHA